MTCIICNQPEHRDTDRMLCYCPNVSIEKATPDIYLRELNEL